MPFMGTSIFPMPTSPCSNSSGALPHAVQLPLELKTVSLIITILSRFHTRVLCGCLLRMCVFVVIVCVCLCACMHACIHLVHLVLLNVYVFRSDQLRLDLLSGFFHSRRILILPLSGATDWLPVALHLVKIPHSLRHVNWWPDNADLDQATVLLRFPGCNFSVMSRTHDLATGILAFWLLQSFHPSFVMVPEP